MVQTQLTPTRQAAVTMAGAAAVGMNCRPSGFTSLTHLRRLEAESIFIMREVVAQAQKPVMLYSIGKDSSVMLRLALKAFYPGKPPFPFLHVDTTWKFRQMYEFREQMAREHGLELLVHINKEGLARGVN